MVTRCSGDAVLRCDGVAYSREERIIMTDKDEAHDVRELSPVKGREQSLFSSHLAVGVVLGDAAAECRAPCCLPACQLTFLPQPSPREHWCTAHLPLPAPGSHIHLGPCWW
ncbi:hypothetical protein O3P69_003222 [Scylla paramamosain]|uniref:Uncharacterized protein n=1 Tax=Scylla paramamosain TaxID=85552 RepID=A0AAW0UNE8_SCYPA